ncbi:TPA: ATP-binding domain-containing protein [Escherichia coli]|uniref:DEAD/DEAH box helicase n=1 Tax=Escherichia coli TaxID=562 RepID=UPI0010AC3F0B|nr:ATP-binding domain-containing protein [Escherichia coli]ELP2866494.1 DEAD/DEAH box helicase [Escherichia coli O33]EKH4115043.1 DEAD/DEAH box helicase [Escherichia coli]EKP3185857.1 DEAD/DEAH box helicase [Escherichia coli]EKP8929731.1 DEAD/DEAH box helicase [Escherichia coli]ELB9136574.1 DEAD/DEAH box helicase [Escherichia coli]
MSSFFYIQPDLKNDTNADFLNSVEEYANTHQMQIYAIMNPLGENKYKYNRDDVLIILSPGYQLAFVAFSDDVDGIQNFIEDFIEDLGSLSDKYNYKDTIGRPRAWKDKLVTECSYADFSFGNLDKFFDEIKIIDGVLAKKSELIISLLTGSINNIDKVKGNVPDNILDKVKQKIILFDGDQTRFVYQKFDKKKVVIQGLSGTGKTELLLHKLKEIYLDKENLNSKIMFTCHNKILADNMRKRIPEFFNFMKVEQQISWNERLWCVNAWGSQYDGNSGAYRYICEYYGLSFYRFSYVMTFDKVCRIALDELKKLPSNEFKHCFDFMLIDESQDFPSSFIELCEQVTRDTIYVAGDIFQSIFDTNISNEIQPDFLLSKCYRTDPRTLMFAHGLGMGLFEEEPLTWLMNNEWEACGYIVDESVKGKLRLKREPLRRFEDVTDAKIHSVELINSTYETEEENILGILRKIKEENPTVLADDIGIIFIDQAKTIFKIADRLELSVPRLLGWKVNKAYETKEKIKDTLFISNKNHVKGLEFPFVICVTRDIIKSHSYRNSLYMMLTRSFIKSYLLLGDGNKDLQNEIEKGLDAINEHGYMDINVPPREVISKIRTTIKYDEKNISHYDLVTKVFDDLQIEPIFRTSLYNTVKTIMPDSFDVDKITTLVRFNYEIMLQESK